MNISSYIITKSSSHLTLAIAKSLPRLAHKYYLSKNNKLYRKQISTLYIDCKAVSGLVHKRLYERDPPGDVGSRFSVTKMAISRNPVKDFDFPKPVFFSLLSRQVFLVFL